MAEIFDRFGGMLGLWGVRSDQADYVLLPCNPDTECVNFLDLGVSKTAIAKLTGVSRTTLYGFIRTRGHKPSP